MNSKANCKDCLCCWISEGALENVESDFSFPEDYECGMKVDLFPDQAYMCREFRYDDS